MERRLVAYVQIARDVTFNIGVDIARKIDRGRHSCNMQTGIAAPQSKLVSARAGALNLLKRERHQLEDSNATSQGLPYALHHEKILRTRKHVLPWIAALVRGNLNHRKELRRILRLIDNQALPSVSDETDGVLKSGAPDLGIFKRYIGVAGKSVFGERRLSTLPWSGERDDGKPACHLLKPRLKASIEIAVHASSPIPSVQTIAIQRYYLPQF